MYIVLSSRGIDDDDPQTTLDSNNHNSAIATHVLGLNSITAICFSGVLIILKINHHSHQIKWYSGIFMVCFIAFLTSTIILIALSCLTLLTVDDD